MECFLCTKETGDKAAILKAPPTNQGYTFEYKFCEDCYEILFEMIRIDREQNK